MKRVLVVMVIGAVLVTGCGRHRAGTGRVGDPPAPAATTSAPVAADDGVANGSTTTSVDKQLTSVDGLLKSLDDQLNADDSAPPDAD
jgi:hypothetical protein